MVPLVICACGTCGISVMILDTVAVLRMLLLLHLEQHLTVCLIVAVGFLLCDVSMCPFFAPLFAGVSSFVFRACCLSFF